MVFKIITVAMESIWGTHFTQFEINPREADNLSFPDSRCFKSKDARILMKIGGRIRRYRNHKVKRQQAIRLAGSWSRPKFRAQIGVALAFSY